MNPEVPRMSHEWVAFFRRGILMSRRSNCNFETKDAFSQTKWVFSCLIWDYESFTPAPGNTWMIRQREGRGIILLKDVACLKYHFWSALCSASLRRLSRTRLRNKNCPNHFLARILMFIFIIIAQGTPTIFRGLSFQSTWLHSFSFLHFKLNSSRYNFYSFFSIILSIQIK